MPRIATIGDVNVDLIARIDRMPDLGKQVVTSDFQTHGGGCSANFSMQCARLGMDIQLFGKLGDDVFGRLADIAAIEKIGKLKLKKNGLL